MKRIILLCALLGASLPTFAQKKPLENVALVKSPEASILYKDCQNEVYFFFSEAQAGKDWIYTSEKASLEILQHRQDYDVLNVLPTHAGKLMITATSGDITQQFELRVRPVPPPVVYLAGYATEQEVNIRNPVELDKIKQLVAKPDADFAQILPTEAQYDIFNASATVFRNGKSIATLQTYNGKFDWEKLSFNENTKEKKILSGDAIQVAVEKVMRNTAKGSRQESRVLQPYISFFVK
jgi:ribosomal protein S16